MRVIRVAGQAEIWIVIAAAPVTDVDTTAADTPARQPRARRSAVNVTLTG